MNSSENQEDADQDQIDCATTQLLREELRSAAKHAGVTDPRHFADQFLPSARFFQGRLGVKLDDEWLSVREVVVRLSELSSG